MMTLALPAGRAAAQDDPLRRLGAQESSVRGDMVAPLDRAIGTPEAARQRLAESGWTETDPIVSYAFWWSSYWAAGIGVGLAIGDGSAPPAPRSYFLEHAQALERLQEQMEQGATPDPGLLAAIDAGMEDLRRRFASTREGLLSCYGLRLGAVLGRSRTVAALLRRYRDLPEETDNEARGAALRAYRAAQSDLEAAAREALVTCIGQVAAALREPAFPLSPVSPSQIVGDEADERCQKLDLAIERLESDLARTKNSIERHLPNSIKMSEQQVKQAEAAIAQLDQRIAPEAEKLKTLKDEQVRLAAAIDRLEKQISDLRQLQRQVASSLPEGARIFSSFEILKAAGGLEGANDREKLDFYNRVSGKRENKLPPRGEFEETYRMKRIMAEMRAAWTAAKLAEVALLFSRKPNDVIGQGILFYWQRYLQDWKPDTPGFLDDPVLKDRIKIAPGQFATASQKLTDLLEQLQAGSERLDALRASGAGAAEIDEAASEMVPVASQFLVETAGFERRLQGLFADLGKARENLDAAIAKQQAEVADLEAEKTSLQESIDYEKNVLIPALMQELETAKARAKDLEEDLKRLKAERARDCAR